MKLDTDSFKTYIYMTKTSAYGGPSTVGWACARGKSLCNNKLPLCLIGLHATQLQYLPPLVPPQLGVSRFRGKISKAYLQKSDWE